MSLSKFRTLSFWILLISTDSLGLTPIDTSRKDKSMNVKAADNF